MATLNQILLDSSAVLDLSGSIPTGDELTLRKNYANQAVEDAAATGQFPEFRTEYTLYTTGSKQVPLAGFREFECSPRALSSTGWKTFDEVELVNREDAVSDDTDFCWITGNPQSGYVANFSANLVAGMSLSVIYQRYPSGMPSLTSVCELSDATYVTRKVESYVLYSRGDDRFQTAEARANAVLLNMTGRKMKSSGGQGRVTIAGFNNPLS
jgi:hypothetical protein